MSQFKDRGFYRSPPKQPPPERGIRMKKAGTTWWGQRWLEALESVLRGDSGRLARGRTYARAGRTHELSVEQGVVRAKVTGTRPTPYEVEILLARLDEAAWAKAIAGMARKAQFSAELLAGQMPQAIDEAFREAGVSLFPTKRAELEPSCTCPDSGDPCKHVAATHYVLGEALDRDPFLLFELRGKTRDEVLDALRAARSEDSGAPRKKRGAARVADEREAQAVPAVELGKLSPADYDKPRAALPSVHFAFDEPAAHGAVLRQLGTPQAWRDGASPAEVLSPLVQRAAEVARRMAMAERQSPASTPPPSPAPEPPDSTEVTPRPSASVSAKATAPRVRGQKAGKRRRARR